MMLNLNEVEKKSSTNIILTKNFLIYFLLIFKLSYFLFYFNKKLCLSLNFFSFEFIHYNQDVSNLSPFLLENKNDSILFLNLFNQKFLFFIIIGFTLLFSMVGSIALCLLKKKN